MNKYNSCSCQFCGKETDHPKIYYAMTPISEDLEQMINRIGRDKWWERLETSGLTEKEQDTLMFYDQLLNTFGKAVVCGSCIERDDKLYLKYYGTE